MYDSLFCFITNSQLMLERVHSVMTDESVSSRSNMDVIIESQADVDAMCLHGLSATDEVDA